MECGSVGVLRQVRIAPRGRGVGDAEWAAEIREVLNTTKKRLVAPHESRQKETAFGRPCRAESVDGRTPGLKHLGCSVGPFHGHSQKAAAGTGCRLLDPRS
jgi:hypothetical protein